MIYATSTAFRTALEYRLLERSRDTGVATASRQVWEERNQATPPRTLPGLPESWRDRYERLATDHDLDAKSFPSAVVLVEALWTAMFGHHSSS